MRTLTYYFLVLDIETSKIVDEEGKPIGTWLSYGFCNLYGIDGTKIDSCYFREWDNLSAFLYKIQSKFFRYKIKCYVHNLAYEFDYIIKNLSRPKNLLSNSSHNIISTTLEEYENIEFCCTYMLSGYALKEIGRQLNFPKLDSDYRDILPHEEITKEEIEYCDRDCDIVAKYIVDVILPEYKTLNNIPVTKTGRVRKKLKELYSEYEKDCTWDFMPPEDCYSAMLGAFAGGLVIVNPMYANLVVKNVKCKDEVSAYPYAGLKEKYPRKIRKIENPTKENLKSEMWIAKIRYNKIESKFNWNWLSVSKMTDIHVESAEFFNGKLICADYVERYVTNIDFENIHNSYYYKSFEVIEFYECYEIDYLPKCLIELFKYYGEKKDILRKKLKQFEKEYGEFDDRTLEVYREYMLAKNDYNSIYGMMVEKLTHDEYIVDDLFLWQKKETKYIYKENKHLKRNFLFGIFITAYARRNLLRAIIKNCPDTLVYSDTDSIKYFEINEFTDTNEPLDGELSNYEFLKNLGKFDDEPMYLEFKTLGAKKYCYRDADGVNMRVAGVPHMKENDENKIHNVKDFKCGVIFKDCKLAKKYINNDYRFELDEDFNIINRESMDDVNKFYADNDIYSNGGVALFPCSYLLDMTEYDKYLIKKYQEGLKIWIQKKKLQNFIHLEKQGA